MQHIPSQNTPYDNDLSEVDEEILALLDKGIADALVLENITDFLFDKVSNRDHSDLVEEATMAMENVRANLMAYRKLFENGECTND